jgi:translation initiation factor IF-2
LGISERTLYRKIKEYDIIYHLIEDLQKQMLRLMEPTLGEVITGEPIFYKFLRWGENCWG